MVIWLSKEILVITTNYKPIFTWVLIAWQKGGRSDKRSK